MHSHFWPSRSPSLQSHGGFLSDLIPYTHTHRSRCSASCRSRSSPPDHGDVHHRAHRHRAGSYSLSERSCSPGTKRNPHHSGRQHCSITPERSHCPHHSRSRSLSRFARFPRTHDHPPPESEHDQGHGSPGFRHHPSTHGHSPTWCHPEDEHDQGTSRQCHPEDKHDQGTPHHVITVPSSCRGGRTHRSRSPTSEDEHDGAIPHHVITVPSSVVGVEVTRAFLPLLARAPEQAKRVEEILLLCL
jgi:hypothetical protein